VAFPRARSRKKIGASFGDFKTFSDEFSSKAMNLFGSGWTWLVADAGKLRVVQTKDADTPIVHGQTPS